MSASASGPGLWPRTLGCGFQPLLAASDLRPQPPTSDCSPVRGQNQALRANSLECITKLNKAKDGQTKPNSAKQGQTRPKRAKQGLSQISTHKLEGHPQSIPVPTCSNSSTETCHVVKTVKRDLQKHTKQKTSPLFSKFSAHCIGTLFSPAAYQRISKWLFPSQVAHKRTDGS